MRFDNAVFETSFGVSSQLKNSDLPEIAFSGKSNVGKSSLLNKILGRKALARVSSMPGKTVTINFFKLEKVRLVDLPGYGYAKVSFDEKRRWSELMEYYFNSDRNIKMVVQLIDMRHKPSDDDFDMLDYLIASGYPFSVALTKSDKLKPTERKKALENMSEWLSFLPEGTTVFPFSAENGEGVDKLKEIIEKIAEE